MKRSDVGFVTLIAIVMVLASTLVYLLLEDKQMREYPFIPADSSNRFIFPQDMEKNDTLLGYLSDSGEYLLHHVGSSGKWDYEYEPSEDRNLPRYNILRHAGTTYSLALIFKYTRDPDHYNGTVRTLNYLLSHHLHFDDWSGTEVAYIEEKGLVKLGGAALAVLAVVEVEEVDPLARYERELDALGEFLLAMQHEDGSFQCFYKDMEDEHSDYYPGEALLALARLYDHTGNDRYLRSLLKGLDNYNPYFGIHYTAYTPWATEAMVYAYSWTNDTSYLDQCYQMAESCRTGQNLPGPNVPETHVGGWGSDPAANSASRVEGVVDSYLLARRTNDTERMERYDGTMEYSARFLINLQYDDVEAMSFPRPDKVKGGTPLSYNEDNIRIDYVQHAVVVMAKIMVYREVDLNI
ncbi:MAG: hypothetical protein JXA22_05790 [Candidatus Thermoplasmatota archaeon]|nr:hypothetical protein [Candidatus Thermoplasmatota archaeon]